MNKRSQTNHWPAEWEKHAATWIAWPHEETDWPGKLETIHWVYVEIVRALSRSERVEILVTNDDIKAKAIAALEISQIDLSNVRFHAIKNDRSWLRDSAPTFVRTTEGKLAAIDWRFNAWAKYDNFSHDQFIAEHIARAAGVESIKATRSVTDSTPLVLEGGAIETDGAGTLLTTEECLLSDVQARNPGMDKKAYEEAFANLLGIQKTIWLGRSCEGDDTHGHIDDVARFTAPGVVVLSFDKDPQSPNHAASLDNAARLRGQTDAQGRELEVVLLPVPETRWYEGGPLPLSYANFYIANSVVLVPTFNDKADQEALHTLSKLFPDRAVVGIHAVDLVLGFGTFHCLTQQQPG